MCEFADGAVEEVVVGFSALAALFLFERFEGECVAEFGVAALGGADLSGGGLVALLDGAEVVGEFGSGGWLGGVVGHELVEGFVDGGGGVAGAELDPCFEGGLADGWGVLVVFPCHAAGFVVDGDGGGEVVEGFLWCHGLSLGIERVTIWWRRSLISCCSSSV